MERSDDELYGSPGEQVRFGTVPLRPTDAAAIPSPMLSLGAVARSDEEIYAKYAGELTRFATGLVGVRTPYPIPRNAIDPRYVPGLIDSSRVVINPPAIDPASLLAAWGASAPPSSPRAGARAAGSSSRFRKRLV